MSEYFQKTSGFNLINGMTYRISAEVPRVDTSGKNVFFTVKSVREWVYGSPNNQTLDYLIEEAF